MSGETPSWTFLETWTAPRGVPSWQESTDWFTALDALTAGERAQLTELRTSWDAALSELGGDPSATDWSTFAPLRRDREEDWSAWLGQLVADSETGVFARSLLAPADSRGADAFRKPVLHREYVIENRRADLVFEWSDRTYAHVEVKVGDPHLEKTQDTAGKLRNALEHCHRGLDFLLVLPEQCDAWDEIRRRDPTLCSGITLITWRDVAVALRQALVTPRGESVRWRVWAHALCGAIEQELLGLAPGVDAEQWSRSMRVPAIHAATELLRAGRRRTE